MNLLTAMYEGSPRSRPVADYVRWWQSGGYVQMGVRAIRSGNFSVAIISRTDLVQGATYAPQISGPHQRLNLDITVKK
jgi:hypothetical protein